MVDCPSCGRLAQSAFGTERGSLWLDLENSALVPERYLAHEQRCYELVRVGYARTARHLVAAAPAENDTFWLIDHGVGVLGDGITLQAARVVFAVYAEVKDHNNHIASKTFRRLLGSEPKRTAHATFGGSDAETDDDCAGGHPPTAGQPGGVRCASDAELRATALQGGVEPNPVRR